MQLTILLRLIHTQGSTLPDKRTALYDRYVDVFFNRESEKSEVVRENRDLLIDIHRYLAWQLHCDSEYPDRRGDIEAESLRHLIGGYLAAQVLDVSAVQDLFAGVVERILFLISRIEGVYEFEVQPLREYFAARHLYETAPYSPPGDKHRGTKPERLDAIARNQHWLNVTRFYAGCFSRGELPCIIDRIHFLNKETLFRLTPYPRNLLAALVRDYVFSQDNRLMQTAMKEVVDSIVEWPLMKLGGSLVPSEDELILSSTYGSNLIAETLLELLQREVPEDFAGAYATLVRRHMQDHEIDRHWMSALKEKVIEPDVWLRNGFFVGVLGRLDTDEIERVLVDRPLSVEETESLIEADHADVITRSAVRTRSAVEAILSGDLRSGDTSNDILSAFARSLDAFRYAQVLGKTQQESPFVNILAQSRRIYRIRFESNVPHLAGDAIEELRKCLLVVKLSAETMTRSCKEWSTSIDHWNAVIELAKQHWGQRWVLLEMANMAAGIISREKPQNEDGGLFDTSISLCLRARYARLKPQAGSWWASRFDEAKNKEDKLWLVLLFSTWASLKTIVTLTEPLQAIISELDPKEWYALYRTVEKTCKQVPRGPSRFLKKNSLPTKLSARSLALIGVRLAIDERKQLYRDRLSDYTGNDLAVRHFCIESALWVLAKRGKVWDHFLELSHRQYKEASINNAREFVPRMPLHHSRMPIGIAREIMQNARAYPLAFTQIAAERCLSAAFKSIKPVGRLSKEGGWFS